MLPSERIPDLYERHATAWDEARRNSFAERGWIDRFLAQVRPGGSVLDLGCGSGRPIAGHLIEAGLRITGIDVAPSLIALCAGRFPDHDWQVADMTKLALGRRFDGILAWDSVFHLTAERQRGMFAIFAAHAAPGAALLFTSGPAAGEAIGTLHGQPLYHASLAPDEYRALLAEHGFAVIDQVAEDADCGGHTIWLAQNAAGAI